LACVAFFLVRYWSWNPGWQDTHRLALVFGALVASMLAGFWVIAGAQPIDFSGKLVLNVIAVLLMAYLARQLRRRKAAG
jgi:FtsH-binding integral membrane protein